MAGDERDVVLLCNPLAGGRWRALAEVLDSPEARRVRRIVIDEVDDLGEALLALGRRAGLLCIHGGDGTIFRVLNLFARDPAAHLPRVALLGGGTMNVTARACGMHRSPLVNFRAVMAAHAADALTWREVPLLAVRAGAAVQHGFTFGLGPVVRLLERYDRGKKGALPALALGARAFAAAMLGRSPRDAELREVTAEVWCDGTLLPYRTYAAIFCNTTGSVNPHVWPFTSARRPDHMHFLAYAASSRSFALWAPLLTQGHLPVDPGVLRRPLADWRQAVLAFVAGDGLPPDPRYVNGVARTLVVATDEARYTIDGEIFAATAGRFEVALGPTVRLVVTARAKSAANRSTALQSV